MHKRGIKQIILLIFFSLLLPASFASEIQPTTLFFDLGDENGWVPFRTGPKPGKPGVFTDLAKALQAQSGIHFKTVHFPQKRAAKALRDGIVDFDLVCLEWFEDNKPGAGFVATDPLFAITEYLVTLKHNAHRFADKKSVYGHTVGTISGYFYYDDNKFTRSDFLNENILIQSLAKERVNVVILERETAKYWADINNVAIDFAALHTSGNLVLRLRQEHQDLLPLLNQSIRAIKRSGELQSILASYRVESKIYPLIPNLPESQM